MRYPSRLASLGASGAAAALLIGFAVSAIPSAQAATAQSLQPNPSGCRCGQYYSPQETAGFTAHLGLAVGSGGGNWSS